MKRRASRERVTKVAQKRGSECSHVFGPSAALNYELCLRNCGFSRRVGGPAIPDPDFEIENDLPSDEGEETETHGPSGQ